MDLLFSTCREWRGRCIANRHFVKARKGGYGRLHMKIHPLITKTDDLAALIARMTAHDFVAVDTEFMRENTYYPDLCLVQIATPDEAAAIDPKADGPLCSTCWSAMTAC